MKLVICLCKSLACLDNLDPDEIYKMDQEDLAYLLTKTVLVRLSSTFNQYKPENSENLQAQIELIEKIAPFDCSRKSITAQNS